MKKRSLCAAMAALMTAAAVGGCSSSSTNSEATASAEETTDTAVAQAEETASEGESESDSESESETQTQETEVHTSKNGIETKDDGVVRTDMTALELSILMGNGINLGNTLESVDGSLGYGLTSDWYETAWGQPVTTQEMITAMHEAGFDTLRIPCAWVMDAMPGFEAVETAIDDYLNGEMDTIDLDLSDADYTIDENYLNRVEEVINYAINEGMYVIVNDHWDGSWLGMYGSATEEIREAANELYISMWTQIAERYAEYGDHLLFASANEELGSRLNDKDIAADSGTLEQDEYYEVMNSINQTFVDTVRSTGGNNENRFLVIQGCNTNIDNTCDSRFEMPTDSAESKLFVDVHYYDPWNYCGDSTTTNNWGTQSEIKYQNEQLAKMEQFTEAGYGVIIGEWGVLFDYNTREQRDNTVDYVTNFLNNCAEYNYVSCLWDTGAQFNRQECTMRNADTAEVFASKSYSAQADMTQEEIIAQAQEEKEAFLEAAPISFTDTDYNPEDHQVATAWIMWNSGDYSITYSVGDTYSPDSTSDGVVAETVEVGGEGFYTVSLDFTDTPAGYSNGTVFSAVGIYNGEYLYPGYAMVITSLKINGEEYELKSTPYTTNDNEYTTRINLYNQWVSKLPDEARTVDGNLDDCDPTGILDTNVQVETIEITFDYVAPEHFEEYATDRDTWAAKELK